MSSAPVAAASSSNGCKTIAGLKNRVELRPMAHHASIVMFMEWNVMMWGLYLLLMFCYDPVFLGDHHPVTYIIAVVCLIGSALMFKRQLRIGSWGPKACAWLMPSSLSSGLLWK